MSIPVLLKTLAVTRDSLVCALVHDVRSHHARSFTHCLTIPLSWPLHSFRWLPIT